MMKRRGVAKNRKKQQNHGICYIATVPGTIKAFFIPQLQYLAANGFDVTVVCSPSETLQTQLGERVTYVPMDIPRGISFVGSLRAVQMLKKLFQQQRFDLIQYSTPNAAFYASIAAKKAGVPARNYHMMGLRYMSTNGLSRVVLKTIEKITCKNSTSIECVSQSNLEIGVGEGLFPRDKATVVWNGSTGGVDLTRFNCAKRAAYRKEIREKLRIGQDEFVFGFVGRITRDKGIDEILEAFQELGSAKLLMVGSFENVTSLNQRLYQASLTDERIIYTGSITEVEKYYSAMNVLLLPSYREGFGNVVIEAAAMGTPAIVSNIPGPIDAVAPNKTAWLVEPRSADNLREVMQQAMKADSTQMGMDAAEFVRTHFDSKVLNEHILRRKMELLGDSCE